MNSHGSQEKIVNQLEGQTVDVRRMRLGPGPCLRNQYIEDYVGVFAQCGVQYDRSAVRWELKEPKIRNKASRSSGADMWRL